MESRAVTTVNAYPPPHWDTVEDVAFWAIVSFLVSLLITFEHHLLVKLGGVSGIVNQTLRVTQSEQGRRNLMTRVGSAVRVFRSNVTYLRKVQPVLFRYLAVVKALVSALVCGLYVYCTYLKRVPDMIVQTQIGLGFMFAASHAFKIWTEDAPLRLVFSLTNLVECLTIASLIMSNRALWLNFNFFRAYHVWITFEKTLKAPNVQRRFQFFISRQIVELVAQAFTFLYIVASGLQLFELIGDPQESVMPGKQPQITPIRRYTAAFPQPGVVLPVQATCSRKTEAYRDFRALFKKRPGLVSAMSCKESTGENLR
mmetsp:Transcript_13063/g.51845  ORF Transcript_13063/g.51845 Transcript_13063/m.51845 type:complete len:313 (-) Transcript_13063:6946-7884(-)